LSRRGSENLVPFLKAKGKEVSKKGYLGGGFLYEFGLRGGTKINMAGR